MIAQTITSKPNLARSPVSVTSTEFQPGLQIETITPAIATQMLAQNHRNRPANNAHVEKLAKEMREGRWKLNGSTICFDSQGGLVDGQHRLMAIVKSGHAIRSYVVRNLDNEVFDTIDSGKRRNGHDTFAVQGEAYYSFLSAAVGIVGNYYGGTPGRRESFSNTELRDILEQHPTLRDSVAFVCRKTESAKFRLCTASLLSSLHYIFSQLDAGAATEFVDSLITGTELAQDSPVFRLRERLVQNLGSKAKLPREEIMALAIKAWNAFRDNRTVKFLRWIREGRGSEEFPVAR